MSGGNNMESLLLNDDDSSSGESDTEVALGSSTTTTSTTQPAAASKSMPAPAPSTAAPPPSSSQSEINQRLKSVYYASSRNKPPQQAQVAQPAVSRPAPTISKGISHQAPYPQQQQQPSGRAPPGAMPTQQHQSRPTGLPAQEQTRSQMPQSQSRQPHSILPPGKPQRGKSDPFEPTPVSKILEREQQKAAQRAAMSAAPHNSSRPPSYPSSQQAPPPSSSRPPYPPQPVPGPKTSRPPQQTYSSQQPGMSSQSRPPQPSSRPSQSTTRPSQQTSRQYQTSGNIATQNSSASSATTAPTSNLSSESRTLSEADRKKQKERFLIFTRVLMKYLEQKDPPLHANVKAIIKDCAERNKRQERGYESVTASMKARLKEVVDDQYWKRAEAYLHHFLQQRQKSTSDKAKAAEAKKAEVGKMRQAQQARQQQAARAPTAPSALASVRQDISNRRQVLTSTAPSSSTSTAPATKAIAAPKYTPPPAAPPSRPAAITQQSKGGKASTPGKVRKPSASPTPVQRKTSTVSEKAEPPVVREYSEFMEMVDHAVNLGEWTSTGLTLGQTTHNELSLSEEQRKLLYGDLSSPEEPHEPSLPLAGWGERNVVSPRVAWARLRLREHKPASKSPVVAAGLLSLPNQSSAIPASTDTSTATTWFNEDVAEEDMALAVLSEGTQIYLRSVLEKALHCSRQRRNLDGIRLWHQQSVPGSKPHLSVRLGCDVSRQIAQAAGNAAMTSKRMEEALERQSAVASKERVLDEDTLSKATSMSELALRPKLAKGAEDAAYEAKRSFEIFGGKEANEPPLGRVPKKARLEVVDFQLGMNFVKPGRQRAGTMSASFSF